MQTTENNAAKHYPFGIFIFMIIIVNLYQMHFVLRIAIVFFKINTEAPSDKGEVAQ